MRLTMLRPALGLLACLALAGCLCEPAGGPRPDGPEMRLIPAGEFLMGSRDSAQVVVQKGGGEPKFYEREHPRHRVRISRPFLLQATEVTNDQFAAFVAATGHRTDAERQGFGFIWQKGWVRMPGADWRHPQGAESGIEGRGRHPVVQVSWRDAQAYCRWLGQTLGRACFLPSEAQWEYACRAGTTTPFTFGETITTDQANYFGGAPYAGGPKGVYRKDTTPAGSFPANAWGLQDMHGNVWEWCADWFNEGYYRVSPDLDPPGPASGEERVVRGGAWNFPARGVRSARRYGRDPGQGYSLIGFRPAAQP